MLFNAQAASVPTNTWHQNRIKPAANEALSEAKVPFQIQSTLVAVDSATMDFRLQQAISVGLFGLHAF